MTQKCPVCGKDLKETYRDCIEGALCELTEECPDGHYQYELMYGGIMERVGDDEFYSYFSDEPESRDTRKEGVRRDADEMRKMLGL